MRESENERKKEKERMKERKKEKKTKEDNLNQNPGFLDNIGSAVPLPCYFLPLYVHDGEQGSRPGRQICCLSDFYLIVICQYLFLFG